MIVGLVIGVVIGYFFAEVLRRWLKQLGRNLREEQAKIQLRRWSRKK